MRRSQRLLTASTTIVINRNGNFSYENHDDEEDLEGGGRRGSRSQRPPSSRYPSLPTYPYPSLKSTPASQQQTPQRYASTSVPRFGMPQFPSFPGFSPQFSNRMPPFVGQQMMNSPAKSVPYKNYRPSSVEEHEIIKKIEQSSTASNQAQSSPPKSHRGFGASANRFNNDGTVDVGEFRNLWRCSWCLLSGKFTPTLRRGPMGSKVGGGVLCIQYLDVMQCMRNLVWQTCKSSC